jgi:murein DD-endopeptidase MepM/ murein hydrolase activator NlpD
LQFRWPLSDVKVTSNFGHRSEGFHEGIDLRAPTGTPVFAAESGKVLYADRRIRGYGRMVVIQHPGRVATVYAHNSKVLVRKGQKVVKGQKIAFSGESGQTRGPHLHFEVRYGASPVDPVTVLKN